MLRAKDIMTEQVDAGDVLQQSFFDITPYETSLTLNAKCYDAAIRSFASLVEGLTLGTVTPQPQNLDERSYFPLYKRPFANASFTMLACLTGSVAKIISAM